MQQMQVIPTRVHGILDYFVGALLIAAPWLFGFNYDGAETWVPVVLGAAAIMYSLCTDYEMGLVRAIGMRTHLMLDLGSGILLAASPWLFGFNDRVWVPHVVIGLIEIGTALMTESVPSDVYRRHPGSRARPSGAH